MTEVLTLMVHREISFFLGRGDIEWEVEGYGACPLVYSIKIAV